MGDKVYSENEYTGERGFKRVTRLFVNLAKTLVHLIINGTKIDTTERHPFWVIGKGWVNAGDLKAGNKVSLKTGEIGNVDSVEVEELDEPVKVYNFEVEDWHTYFVSDIGVLVHNKCWVDAEGALPTRTLYRGDRSSLNPQTVFEEGFKPKGTHNDLIKHISSNTTPGNFVSTSPDKSIAQGFANKNGYIYEIETSNYIDVNKALGDMARFEEQREFSIPGGVKPSEIKGYWSVDKWKVSEEFIRNPNFKGGK